MIGGNMAKKTTLYDVKQIKKQLIRLVQGADTMIDFLENNKEFECIQDVIKFMEKHNEK
jgi:hypothetical protein